MSVIALEVTEKHKHPNAHSLFVYTFCAPSQDPVTVVANSEGIYELGDIVAVALPGTTLLDGTHITPLRLRGIGSFGMALGTTEAPLGADLTHTLARSEPQTSDAEVIKWTSIELLHNVVRHLETAEGSAPTVTYRAKIKLDGTNGGVQITPDGEVFTQSRSRIITSSDDNAGFAAWVAEHRDFFAKHAIADEHIVIFGEWCGQGIQKRTAISRLDRRVFAVFAIQYGDHQRTAASLEVEPEQIRAFLGDHPDVFVLPWSGEPITLPFSDREALRVAASTLNARVAEVERCDPWVRERFGIEGLGEGIVLYPEVEGRVARAGYMELMFKAKGEEHRVVRQKKPAQLDPEVARSVAAFVQLFVTPARLEQGVVEACQGCYEMKRMGRFLKWLGQDVKKESAAELEAAQLSWRDVSKAVTQAAKKWFQGQAQAI